MKPKVPFSNTESGQKRSTQDSWKPWNCMVPSGSQSPSMCAQGPFWTSDPMHKNTWENCSLGRERSARTSTEIISKPFWLAEETWRTNARIISYTCKEVTKTWIWRTTTSRSSGSYSKRKRLRDLRLQLLVAWSIKVYKRTRESKVNISGAMISRNRNVNWTLTWCTKTAEVNVLDPETSFWKQMTVVLSTRHFCLPRWKHSLTNHKVVMSVANCKT